MYEIDKTVEFEAWLSSVRDPLTRGRLLARLRRVALGNLGDVAPISESSGIWEMREHFGAGWRMYYLRRGRVIILMLGGGCKATQNVDIRKVKKILQAMEEQMKKTKKIKTEDLSKFDVVDYLKTEADIAGYLTAVLEDGDSALFVAAIGDIARAKGMTDIAKKSGVTRESLYRALKIEARPRFETVARVINALGMKLSVHA